MTGNTNDNSTTAGAGSSADEDLDISTASFEELAAKLGGMNIEEIIKLQEKSMKHMLSAQEEVDRALKNLKELEARRPPKLSTEQKLAQDVLPSLVFAESLVGLTKDFNLPWAEFIKTKAWENIPLTIQAKTDLHNLTALSDTPHGECMRRLVEPQVVNLADLIRQALSLKDLVPKLPALVVTAADTPEDLSDLEKLTEYADRTVAVLDEFLLMPNRELAGLAVSLTNNLLGEAMPQSIAESCWVKFFEGKFGDEEFENRALDYLSQCAAHIASDKRKADMYLPLLTYMALTPTSLAD
jgi:predicted transcriptional regulator